MAGPLTISGAQASRLAATRFSEIVVRDEVESTNSSVLALARAGVPEGAVLAADHQTAGRGRLGRQWHSAKGSSLLVSVLLRPDLPPSDLAVVPLACALSLAEALEEVAGFRPGLKWPNDLVVGERKLVGILAETDLAGAEVRGIVVGAGVNVGPGSFPSELGNLATAAELVAGRPVDRGALLVAYLVALEGTCRSLLGPGGPEAVLETCRIACVTLGRIVRVEVPGGVLRGTAETLGAGGELVVVRPGGERESVSAGDVVHLRDD